MATVWQGFNLFPWRTVADNVAFGLEVAGIARQERIERTRRCLAQVDMAGFEAKHPRQLSGGMRQRVGLARALVMEPDVLLLDEPFGALDAQTRLVLQEQLARLVEKSGTTAVLVTHSIEEAILLADTILVMTARPGRIAAEIGVALPRPRSLSTTHLSGYSSLFDQIYGLLRDEVVKAMAIETESVDARLAPGHIADGPTGDQLSSEIHSKAGGATGSWLARRCFCLDHLGSRGCRRASQSDLFAAS